ncbi:uncharacterized protein LOC144153926 [Haemaphysalis longicornis]
MLYCPPLHLFIISIPVPTRRRIRVHAKKEKKKKAFLVEVMESAFPVFRGGRPNKKSVFLASLFVVAIAAGTAVIAALVIIAIFRDISITRTKRQLRTVEPIDDKELPTTLTVRRIKAKATLPAARTQRPKSRDHYRRRNLPGKQQTPPNTSAALTLPSPAELTTSSGTTQTSRMIAQNDINYTNFTVVTWDTEFRNKSPSNNLKSSASMSTHAKAKDTRSKASSNNFQNTASSRGNSNITSDRTPGENTTDPYVTATHIDGSLDIEVSGNTITDTPHEGAKPNHTRKAKGLRTVRPVYVGGRESNSTSNIELNSSSSLDGSASTSTEDCPTSPMAPGQPYSKRPPVASASTERAETHIFVGPGQWSDLAKEDDTHTHGHFPIPNPDLDDTTTESLGLTPDYNN